MREFIKEVEINDDNLNDLKLEKILAFKFATAGAMGDCGGIDFLTAEKEIKYYHMNYAYGDEKIADKVFAGFFKPISDIFVKSDSFMMPEIDGWKTYMLGYGNYLYLRNEYVEKFEEIANAYHKDVINYVVTMYKKVDEFLYYCFK